MRLTPYQNYKASGVEWLGDVPAHWEVRRFKHLCTQSALYGANIAASHYTETGVRFLRTTDITDEGFLKQEGVFLPKELVHDYLLNDGDILISRSGTVGRSFLYKSELHGSCSYAGYLVRFIFDSSVLPQYVFLFTKTQNFVGFLRVMAISSTIENVNGEKYANASIPLPPISEQIAIVRYLGYFDRRIQRYIREKQKLIKLLEEQKQAVIQRAVARGLDPDVPLKPSGVDWLGDVPVHWKVRQLGRIGQFSKGSGGTKEDEVASGVPCIRYGDLYTEHQFFIRKSRTCVLEEKASIYAPTQYGDVLFAGSGETIEEIGKSAVNLIPGSTVCGGDVILFRPSIAIDAIFLGYATDCPQATYQKACMGRGITIMHIYSTELKNLYISLPPLPEQTAIAEYLDKVTTDIDAKIALVRQQAELMHEYRTRLIADVVTGKLDVRKAAAELSDEPDNPEA